MKKIINSNSGCEKCINWGESDCSVFAEKMASKNGLVDCIGQGDLINYIYEKETKMKLTKEEKFDLKVWLDYFYKLGGFTFIMANGITLVFIPDLIKSGKNVRMYRFGQSVCNPKDKYNRKRGIYNALRNLNDNDNLMPVEMIKGLMHSHYFILSTNIPDKMLD